MKLIKFILIFLFSKSVFCQTTFVVDNFSKDYFGKLFIADTTEVFSKGWVAIFDKKSKKQLLKIDSDELTFNLHKGKILANINEIPYGEQSQILYNDYNFDGTKDFAIMDGQNSCYHGPSFQIFLSINNKFILSPTFTELSQNNCGMFDVDFKTKTIFTMTKSGCCWHQSATYKVEDNKPYPIKIVEEGYSASGILLEYKEQNLVNKKMVETSYETLALELNDENLVLLFEFENKKKMKVFISESILYYVFTDANDKIELIYNYIFKNSKSENNLTFTNRKTQYTIYNDKIIVKTPKNIFEMKAVPNSIKGNLTKLKDLKIENLIN